MIYITGDTHSEFERLGKKHCPAGDGDYVIVCGDFGGVWDGSEQERYWRKWLSEKPFTTLFLDGNHENFNLLNAYPVTEWKGGKVHRIAPNILHLMRGQVFEIDGVRFFTMGGASSHDIAGGILDPDAPDFAAARKRLNKSRIPYRINGVTWWSEELPSEEELAEGLANLARYGNKVDCVLTHCAPGSLQEQCGSGLYRPDRLTDYLEAVKDRCEFALWCFAHYHYEKRFDGRFVLLYESILPLTDLLPAPQ